MKFSKIVIFGAGNLAFHLAEALHLSGYRIAQIYSRTQENAITLANKVNAQPITNINDFDPTASILIFALTDSVLPDIVNKIEFSGQLALHTSGSLPIDIFKGKAEHYGVLYPLQTFSKFRKVNFYEVPLLIEAGNPKDLANLQMFASSLCARTLHTASSQRRKIHLSAMFASNFVNHMYSIGEILAKKAGFSFDILKPMILETALKAIESSNPVASQTGPAVRCNTEILANHSALLSDTPSMQKIYNSVSNSIGEMYHNKTLI